jgi:hypothetical protein
MVVNLLVMRAENLGYMKVKRSETDMWNNLCIFLVANDVKCCIIYS